MRKLKLVVLSVLLLVGTFTVKSEASPLLNVPLAPGCSVNVVVDSWYPILLWHYEYVGTC